MLALFVLVDQGGWADPSPGSDGEAAASRPLILGPAGVTARSCTVLARFISAPTVTTWPNATSKSKAPASHSGAGLAFGPARRGTGTLALGSARCRRRRRRCLALVTARRSMVRLNASTRNADSMPTTLSTYAVLGLLEVSSSSCAGVLSRFEFSSLVAPSAFFSSVVVVVLLLAAALASSSSCTLAWASLASFGSATATFLFA
mmetsp:Transcript_21472/g.55210  ORF Transcript_21472/g.55210 Transcript_21472/m.55210 type:complete len:204 (-) Transcript_21472:737-1348(-)